MGNVLYTAENGKQFWCSADQSKILDTLKDLNHGGIGTVHGYVPESGYVTPPKVDLQIITKISVNSLYKRKIEALEKITFDDVLPKLSSVPKLAALPLEQLKELFNVRKQGSIDSMNKSLSGDRSDTAREGHDRNYITVTQGVKVNLVGTTYQGVKTPDTFQGHPIADSILLMYLEVSRKVITEGVKKVVNSGAPVLMSEAIDSLLNSRSVSLRTLSLDPKKFDKIVVSKRSILKEDLKTSFKEMSMVDLILSLIGSDDVIASSNGKKIINHVAYVLDVSGSMAYHIDKVRGVLESGLEAIRAVSRSMSQDTLVSLYTFNDYVTPVFVDRHINDINMNSIRFRASGSTALLDATLKAIYDGLATQARNSKDESHAYLLNVITDGEENVSRASINELRGIIAKLNDEWTLAIQVPNQSGVHYAKQFGFPANNIAVWDTNSSVGLEESVRDFSKGFTAYATSRSAGATQSNNYYSVDLSQVTKSTVKSNLVEIAGKLYHCQSGPVEIRDFVEKAAAKVYHKGNAYYELTKTEIIQPYKDLVVVHRKDGRKYGGDNARSLLGLPATQCKVTPANCGEWRVFVQSTSVNRKVTTGTSVFVKD